MKKLLLICLLVVIAVALSQYALHRIHVRQQEAHEAYMRKYGHYTYDPFGDNIVHEAPLPKNTLRVKLTQKEAEAIQRLENQQNQ